MKTESDPIKEQLSLLMRVIAFLNRTWNTIVCFMRWLCCVRQSADEESGKFKSNESVATDLDESGIDLSYDKKCDSKYDSLENIDELNLDENEYNIALDKHDKSGGDLDELNKTWARIKKIDVNCTKTIEESNKVLETIERGQKEFTDSTETTENNKEVIEIIGSIDTLISTCENVTKAISAATQYQ